MVGLCNFNRFGRTPWDRGIWKHSPFRGLRYLRGRQNKSAEEILVICPKKGGQKIAESECVGCDKYGYWRAGAEALCKHRAEELAEQEAKKDRGGKEFEEFLKFHGPGSREKKAELKDEDKDEDEHDDPEQHEEASESKFGEEGQVCGKTRKIGGLFISGKHKDGWSEPEDMDNEEKDGLDDEHEENEENEENDEDDQDDMNDDM
jgi:hypothetical protein